MFGRRRRRLVESGRLLLGALLGLSCRARATAYADERLARGWRFRLDAAYDATVTTSHAIPNLRLVELVGKTERFWSQHDITERIAAAFDA